jgi:hypothetical protein
MNLVPRTQVLSVPGIVGCGLCHVLFDHHPDH